MMTISQLINQLEELKKEHGDLPIWTFRVNGSYYEHHGAEFGVIRKLRGREEKRRLWHVWDEKEDKDKNVIIL